jgi:hypothetical protein
MSSIKPLPTDLRDHLAELTGNELKVWMSYYLHTGNYDLTSHPGNGTIERDTGMCNDTVKTCKASLRAKRWLTYTGDYKQPRRPGGTFAVPVMEVRLPWRPDWSAVVTDVSMAYDAITVVEKPTHGTVVEIFHPEGSSSCSGSSSGSSSLSSSCAATPSDSSKSPKGVPQHKEKIEAKSKPENLEPEPTPSKPGPKGHGQDGTPYPEEFDDWSNLERLRWLEAHGWRQASMAETASHRTGETGVAQAKPTPTATPLAPAPHSASPPRMSPSAPSAPATKRCAGCGGPVPCRDEWCYCYEPAEVNPPTVPVPGVPDDPLPLGNEDFDA